MKIYKSLESLHQCLTANGISYALIGGLAVAVWGEPRLTRDIDVKILLPRDESERLLSVIEGRYRPVGENPIELLKRNGILFVVDYQKIRIDFQLSDTLFDRQAIERARDVEIYPGAVVRVCTPEDLIIYKMLSTRAVDSYDVSGIINHQGNRLNDDYIIYWLKQFEEALDDSTLIRNYRMMRNL